MEPGFTATQPHNGAFIVYINGIEVPCKSVTERQGVWQIPEMQIEMVADPVLTRLGAEDRVQVVVFYLDDIIVSKAEQPGPTFRLFGEGEITGWGYQNTPSGRSITFTCVNQFAIFTQLFVQFLTTVDDMVGYAVNPTSGVADTATVSSALTFPFSLFKEGLGGRLAEDTSGIKRPFDFMYNLLRNMVGKQPTANQNAASTSVPSANFFARWARLTNFINRFVATPVFDDFDKGDPRVFPILKALQDTAGVDTIVNALIPQVQNRDSIFAMLQLVYQTVFMEIAMLPRMPLVDVDLATGMIQETDFETHRLDKPIVRNPKKPRRLANYFAKPQMLFGLPPACNVVFPSQLNTLSYDENYATQPTRLYFNDEVINKIVDTSGSVGEAISSALTTGYPPEVDAANKARILSKNTHGKNFLLFPEEFFKGPVMDRRSVPPWLFFLRQIEAAQQRKNEQTQGGVPKVEKPSVAAPPDQDAQYALIQKNSPDVYRLYAQYEYYRERYSQRTGGVSIAFNPYVIPGFPTLILDNRNTRVDLFAYVTTVSHTLTHRGRNTSFSFAYARTVQEMFDVMGQTFAEGSLAAAGAGPPEPLRDVRAVVQDFTEAENFYRRLLYGDKKYANKNASCDWRKIIAYAPAEEGGEPEAIFINGTGEKGLDTFYSSGETLKKTQPLLDDAKKQYAQADEKRKAAQSIINGLEAEIQDDPSVADSPYTQSISLEAQKTVADTTKTIDQLSKKIREYEKAIYDANIAYNGPKPSKVSHNLDGRRELVPTEAAEEAFESYDAATAYNWRPICSLDEYLIFHGYTGEDPIPAFGHPQSVGARYFARINRFTPLTSGSEIVRGADGLNTTGVANTGALLPNGHAVVSVTDPVTGKVTFRDSTTGEKVDPPSAKQGTPSPVTGAAKSPPRTTVQVQGLKYSSFPQTRADWDTILLAYRYNAYIKKTPME